MSPHHPTQHTVDMTDNIGLWWTSYDVTRCRQNESSSGGQHGTGSQYLPSYLWAGIRNVTPGTGDCYHCGTDECSTDRRQIRPASTQASPRTYVSLSVILSSGLISTTRLFGFRTDECSTDWGHNARNLIFVENGSFNSECAGFGFGPHKYSFNGYTVCIQNMFLLSQNQEFGFPFTNALTVRNPKDRSSVPIDHPTCECRLITSPESEPIEKSCDTSTRNRVCCRLISLNPSCQSYNILCTVCVHGRSGWRRETRAVRGRVAHLASSQRRGRRVIGSGRRNKCLNFWQASQT